MGKISDAFERHEKESLLKVNVSIRKEPIGVNQVIRKPTHTEVVRSYEGLNEKLVVVSSPESADAESFRLLRSNILFAGDGEKPRTILVTSALPGEGKSFVASNLAASIAVGTDRQVLIVDSDLRRPNIDRIFGCNKKEGLCEYLNMGGKLEDLIVPTKVPRLSMLPAGTVPACPGESISASEMEGFIRDVKKHYQNWVVIIDSAPSHITAAARVIANYVDGILFVVMAQKWPRKEIQKSIGALGKEKILGVVFNGYVQARRRYYKYYDSYYRGE